jgi:hypothetical protein
MDKTKLLILACFTGFVGDAILQLAVERGPFDWGLKNYFEQHGSTEALFIAGGMLSLFFSLFILSGIKINYLHLAVYGVILDLLFRKLDIFPSLDGYYESLNYFWSAVWGAIPMMIPLFLHDNI